MQDFADAVHLYFRNEDVANFNYSKLQELHQPIAKISARHSSTYAAKLDSDEMSGLEPCIFVAKEAKVMLTMNLWTDVGLCNGSAGQVVDIIYGSNNNPPDLPIAVIVQFDEYSGPSFLGDQYPECVPICPITASIHVGETVHERQQLPLRLSWAMTIHKAQGLTLSKAWIDIGKSERVAGISYVALSRVKQLSHCIIEPMTFARLSCIRNSRTCHCRLEEESSLDELASKYV